MAHWIKFKLVQRPYYDPRTGEELASIEGLGNRPNIDPFAGGGAVYPDLTEYRVLERRENENELIVLIDDPDDKIDRLLSKTDALSFAATPKHSRAYTFSDFKPVKVPPGAVVSTLVANFKVKPEEIAEDLMSITPTEVSEDTGRG